MKRIVFYFTVMFGAFAIGVGTFVVVHHKKVSPRLSHIPKPEVSHQECPLPGVFRVDMLKAIPVANEAAKVVNIRLVDEKSSTSDFLIEVENVTPRRITDLWYVLAPFADCPNADSLPKQFISTAYPEMAGFAPKRILRPHQAITLRIPREMYENMLKARNHWQCPCSVKSELWFYGAGFVGAPLYEY